MTSRAALELVTLWRSAAQRGSSYDAITLRACADELGAALEAGPSPLEPNDFFQGWNPGWVKIWKEHEAKHPIPPHSRTWEQAYRHLALAVNSMPDTCDDRCNSHGHSEACSAKEAAWPAEEIVRLRALVVRGPSLPPQEEPK